MMTPSDTLSFETTLHVRDTCLSPSAQRVARTLARRFDIAFKPVGLTSGQFSLLMSLNRPEPPSLGVLAALLAMDRTTLTAKLKPLERRGLIETAADPKDRRMRLLRLTPEGNVLLARAYPIWARTHAGIDAKLSAARRPARGTDDALSIREHEWWLTPHDKRGVYRNDPAPCCLS